MKSQLAVKVRWIVVLIGICIWSCLAGPCYSIAAESIKTIAFTGSQAYGLPVGVEYSNLLYNPAINESGDVAYFGSISGSGISPTSGFALWLAKKNGLTDLVVRQGTRAPGTPDSASFIALGGNESQIENPLLNRSGSIVFEAAYQDSNNEGIWRYSHLTGVELVARTLGAAPGTSNTFVDLDRANPKFSDAGTVAFLGEVGGFDRTGIWRDGDTSDLQLVARQGFPAPAPNESYVWRSFVRTRTDVAMSDASQIAFYANAELAVEGTEIIGGVWAQLNRGLELIAQDGQQVAGVQLSLPPGSAVKPTINSKQHVAFVADFTKEDATQFSGSGVWVARPNDSLELLARTDLPPLGLPAGYDIASYSRLTLNAVGQVAFTGVSNGKDSSLWIGSGVEELNLVALSGQSAPGTSENVYFDEFTSHVINANGQIAFRASLSGVGVDDSNRHGIWALDSSNQLTLIVREGEAMDVDDGPTIDMRIIAALNNSLASYGVSGNDDARGSAFNDYGQLAFSATFSDGSSGIFVSNVLAVPEPKASTALALAVMAVAIPAYMRRGFPNLRTSARVLRSTF